MRSSIHSIASWCNLMLADGTVVKAMKISFKVDLFEFSSLLLFMDKVESLVKLWFHRTVASRHACYNHQRKHIKTVMQRDKLQLSKNQFSITNILSSSKKKSSSKSIPRPVIVVVSNICTRYLFISKLRTSCNFHLICNYLV